MGRYSKHEKKLIYNGIYNIKETAAHASDTLARELIANGEQGHRLNFSDDEIEVFPEEKMKSSQYIGVCYDVNTSKWRAQRRSKDEKRMVHNGRYDNEETAAHASDTLVKKWREINGGQGNKLNFPENINECQRKRKRSDN